MYVNHLHSFFFCTIPFWAWNIYDTHKHRGRKCWCEMVYFSLLCLFMLQNFIKTETKCSHNKHSHLCRGYLQLLEGDTRGVVCEFRADQARIEEDQIVLETLIEPEVGVWPRGATQSHRPDARQCGLPQRSGERLLWGTHTVISGHVITLSPFIHLLMHIWSL